MKEELNKYMKNENRVISDLFSGLTESELYIKNKHKKSYWKHEEVLSAEEFVHFTSSTIMNPESLKVIKKYFPKSLAIYNEIIQDALGE